MFTTYHIVLLGETAVGKSASTVQLIQEVFVENYDPTIEDSYIKKIEVDGSSILLEILDTANCEEFEELRNCSIQQADGFVLMYSITDEKSFVQLQKYHENILSFCGPTKPIILVGNKSDLDNDRCVKGEDGIRLAEKFGNCTFMETSAKYNQNILNCFQTLARKISIQNPKKIEVVDEETITETKIKEEEERIRLLEEEKEYTSEYVNSQEFNEIIEKAIESNELEELKSKFEKMKKDSVFKSFKPRYNLQDFIRSLEMYNYLYSEGFKQLDESVLGNALHNVNNRDDLIVILNKLFEHGINPKNSHVKMLTNGEIKSINIKKIIEDWDVESIFEIEIEKRNMMEKEKMEKEIQTLKNELKLVHEKLDMILELLKKK